MIIKGKAPKPVYIAINNDSVEIRDASLHLFIDSDGEGNYMLQGKKTAREDNGRLIDIANLRLHNLQILLDNRAKQIKSNGHLDQLELNGRFSRNNTQIKGIVKGSLGEISNKGILYASDRQIRTYFTPLG